MSRYSRHNPEEPIRHDWTAGGRKPEAQGSFDAPSLSVEAAIRSASEMNEKFTFSDPPDEEPRKQFCLSCGATHYKEICPECGSDAQDEL